MLIHHEIMSVREVHTNQKKNINDHIIPRLKQILFSFRNSITTFAYLWNVMPGILAKMENMPP